MEYPVIVERKDGIWRAFIPVLSGLAGEGRSRDEALVMHSGLPRNILHPWN